MFFFKKIEISAELKLGQATNLSQMSRNSNQQEENDEQEDGQMFKVSYGTFTG
jgi:hypothetical protein